MQNARGAFIILKPVSHTIFFFFCCCDRCEFRNFGFKIFRSCSKFEYDFANCNEHLDGRRKGWNGGRRISCLRWEVFSDAQRRWIINSETTRKTVRQPKKRVSCLTVAKLELYERFLRVFSIQVVDFFGLLTANYAEIWAAPVLVIRFQILQESMKIRTARFIVLSVVTMNKLLCLPENIVCARVPHLFACDQPIVLLLLQWNFEISVLSKTFFFLTLFFSLSFPPLVWDWPCDKNQKKNSSLIDRWGVGE